MCDAAAQRAGAAELLHARVECGELRPVACSPSVAVDASERPEHPPDLVTGSAARRGDARTAAQPVHLDAGILAEHPCVRRCTLPGEERLAARVLVIGRARLGRIVVGVEPVDLPAGQQALELARLVRVAGGEDRLQSQRTSATCGTSATRATRWWAASSLGSSTAISSRRRLPSSPTPIDEIRAPASWTSSI